MEKFISKRPHVTVKKSGLFFLPLPPPSNSSTLPRNRLFTHQCEICSHGWRGHDDDEDNEDDEDDDGEDEDDDDETSMTRISRGNEQISCTIQQTVLTNGTMESDYHQPTSIYFRPRSSTSTGRLVYVFLRGLRVISELERDIGGEKFLFCFSKNWSFVLLRVIIAYMFIDTCILLYSFARIRLFR